MFSNILLVIFEFKPTELPPEVANVLCIFDNDNSKQVHILTQYTAVGEMLLEVGDPPTEDIRIDQLQKVGEWTKIEVTHEVVDQHGFQGPVLTFSIGGKELTREMTSNMLENIEDIQIYTGDHAIGIIRGLVLLEKD